MRRLVPPTLAALVLAAAAVAATPSLTRLVLRAAQVGPGYTLVQRPDGHGANGFVTLDLCGYHYASEAKRTGRLQVNYIRLGSPLKFSNEVVTYARGGTALAMREVKDAVDHCPRGPVTSPVQGVPPLTYRIAKLSTSGLLRGAVNLRVRVSGVVNGKTLTDTVAVAYQVSGNRLSGVYGYGGTTKAREAATLRAAKQSAKNLVG